MPDAFKNLINARTVADAATHLHAAWPAFDRRRFERLAGQGLDGLEMKARAMQIAQALDSCLPGDFERAATLIEAALAPVDDQGDAARAGGLSGWVLWSLGEFVACRVAQRPADLHRGLQCLHALTQRFTAEFAIRPLLRDHPGEVWPVLKRWSEDPSAAVRRLASEGSRPRLPWGLRLQASVADPRPAYAVLQRLQDDSDEAVRRSVANHLNDIAKDHPDLLADWLDQHLPEASAERRALLRHASRTLIKQGHPRVLAAWGVGGRFKGAASFSVSPNQVQIGDELTLALQLQSRSRSAQTLVIDYAVHHMTARGIPSPKVFKGWNLTLAPGEERTLTRRHSLKPITTRRYYVGWHAVTLNINGTQVADAGFTLA
ncbi:DNA alkylation repair protein [Ideonella sp.]|uniref:DNA alkylation repair protein n=1 Tax=Ideonella sp. TaxID=1929293 RepID=UPI0035AD80EB